MMSLTHHTSPASLARAAGTELPSFAIETIVDAIYAQPPTPDQLALWKEIAPRRSWISAQGWPTAPVKRAAICIGRRGLKTSGVLAWSCVFEALCGRHENHTLPGSRLYHVVVAPRVAQAREAVRAIRSVLDQLAVLGVKSSVRDLAGAPEIVIEDATSSVEKVITVMTADAVAVRGFAICFAAFDEAGFFPTAEHHAQTDKDVLRALVPAMTTFPDAKLLLVSSPGAPQGIFHSWVTKPPRGTLVVRCSSWVANPRVTEAKCRADSVDDAMFEQEFACTRFGYAGENFIDGAAALACIDEEGTLTPKGARPMKSAAIIAVDTASTGDDAAFAVGYSLSRKIGEHTAPIREIVIELVETWAASRANPITIERIAERVAALSASYGGVPVIADNRGFTDLAAYLASRHGFKICKETDEADRQKVIARGGRVIVERPMTPVHQTSRWRHLRGLVVGKRLHLPAGDEGEKCARQMGQLKATTLSSGWLKIDGKKDDAADVVALLAEACEWRAPVSAEGGICRWIADSTYFAHGRGLQVSGDWWTEYPDGRRVRGGHIDVSHPDFYYVMREAIAAGRAERHFDDELARLRGKTIAALTVDDARWFTDQSGLGISTDHLVPLDEVTEPVTEPAWFTIANRRLPRM